LVLPFADLGAEGNLVSGSLGSDFSKVSLVVETAGLFLLSAGLETFVLGSVPVDLESTDTDHLV